MTKKHFIDLANELKTLRRHSTYDRDGFAQVKIRDVEEALMKVCRKYNPNLDARKFQEAIDGL